MTVEVPRSIYVAGPVVPQRFYDARQSLEEQGWEVHMLVDPDRPQQVARTRQEHAAFMQLGIPMLLGCRAIGLLPGWPYSPGTMIELTTAIATAKDIYTLEPRGPGRGYAVNLEGRLW